MKLLKNLRHTLGRQPVYRSTRLENVEEVHRAHPRTYSIPRSEQRHRLQVGDLVKLVFLLDSSPPGGPRAERMWVEVVQVKDGVYTGRLESKPAYITDPKVGDEVEFGPEHVAALYQPPDKPQVPCGKMLLVSQEVVNEKRWPRRLIRRQPVDEKDSGWLILGDDGPEDQPGNGEGFVERTVDSLIDQYRILDSVLDESVGTEWCWSDEAAEYQQVVK